MISSSLLKQVAVGLSALSALGSAAPTFRLGARSLAFDYNNDKVQGVNLGGWFVLEPWITPSIFEAAGDNVVDEYTFCQTLGSSEAYSRLSDHWNSWITQSDFSAIANAGLNHVRIPIGYWAVAPLQGDPYVQGQLDVLDQAITWARSAGLKVLIDLHGAPGSQNGYDNSGRYGPVDWQQGDTVQQTINAIQGLASRYSGDTDVVTTIETLNEPLSSDLNTGVTEQYDENAYTTITDASQDYAVTIHDMFEDITSLNGFMSSGSGFSNIILDTHQYQVFSSDQLSQSLDDHVSTACSFGSDKLNYTDKWTVVGEWSGAMTDCALWLNGRNKGARYDGSYEGSSYIGSCDGLSTGSVASFSDSQRAATRQYIEAQMDAYDVRTGWFFWTWKTESSPEWDMQQLLANGLFPQPLADRKYWGQCGTAYTHYYGPGS